jgi:hypothetical protein
MGRRRPPCPSGKQRFRDQHEARLVLAKIRARKAGRTRIREEQTYRCTACGGWHLTSAKPKTKPKETR